ncbi:MAG: lytic transglycosylase domain-containing protein [Clostridia bacterium]|nr:lytic transglycosylase domain-containing protein [Clostridia bacterium]
MNRILRTILIILILSVASVIIFPLSKHIKINYDFTNHPRQYSEFVTKYAKEYGVPEKICYAVIKCESGFDFAAKSSAGAMGLMQMMPATFEDLCSRLDEEHDTSMLFDPETSIKYGVYYLSGLYKRFGVWENAIAAYNCGQGRVAGWIESGMVDENGILTDIPISETATYVKRVTKAIEKYEELYYQ